jgi:CheY-like chemotaxis protein
MAKILLIENNKSVRRTLSAALRGAGHDLLEAEDGADGIELLRQSTVDLIVMEMLLDNLDGTAVLAFLETQPIRPPVIALSGGNDQIPAELALLPAKPFAAAALTKPVNENELTTAVAKALTK